MLSETQEKWIKNKENQLTQLIQNNWPLSDDDWAFVADFLTKTMTLARDNEEIRKRLLDILEFYDKKDKEEKCQKKIKVPLEPLFFFCTEIKPPIFILTY